MKSQGVPRIGQKIGDVVSEGGGLVAKMSLWLQQYLQGLGRNPTTAITEPTLSASPWTWENKTDFDQDLIVSGGTVSDVDFSRDSISFYALPNSGVVRLNPGDAVRVTYSAAPSITVIPR